MISYLTLMLLLAIALSAKLKDPVIDLWTQTMWYGQTPSYAQLPPSLTKKQWITKYKRFLNVPDWLAQQQFLNCDTNNDGKISGEQYRCF